MTTDTYLSTFLSIPRVSVEAGIMNTGSQQKQESEEFLVLGKRYIISQETRQTTPLKTCLYAHGKNMITQMRG